MAKDLFLVIRGVLDYAKLTGSARPHTGHAKYDKGPSWSTDITPDKKSRKLLVDNGLEEKLKEPKASDTKRVGTEEFITLRVLENRADGTKNDPPTVKDVRGNLWTGGLLGNGTVADIKVKVKDYGAASEKGVYLQAVRILEHVPYESNDFAPLSEDDKYFATSEESAAEPEPESAPSKNLDDLDDDVPFDIGD